MICLVKYQEKSSFPCRFALSSFEWGWSDLSMVYLSLFTLHTGTQSHEGTQRRDQNDFINSWEKSGWIPVNPKENGLRIKN